MAFLLPLAEGLGAAGAAEGAAGAAEAGAAGEAGGGGLMSKLGGLFKGKPSMMPGEQGKQQNVGASRTDNFVDSVNQVRGALRPGAGGVD